MNRTEAKAYALTELGLDRDDVRQFGNLSRTQTWLDAIAAQEALATGEAMIIEVTPAIAIHEPTSLDNSFEAFWDSAPALLHPHSLINVSALDGDWDDPEFPTSQASEVIVYPIVIGLLMLWAIVQLLLLAGHGIAQGLTALANALDAAASRRLNADAAKPSDPMDWAGILAFSSTSSPVPQA
jgi:hypothetical protein